MSQIILAMNLTMMIMVNKSMKKTKMMAILAKADRKMVDGNNRREDTLTIMKKSRRSKES